MGLQELLCIEGAHPDSVAVLKVTRIAGLVDFGVSIGVDVVIVANVLAEVIHPFEAVGASVLATVGTRVPRST